MLDGKSKGSSGGNHQREAFKAKVSAMPKGGMNGAEMKVKSPNEPKAGDGSEGKTTITHHPDGSHSIEHHDGEKSEHPSMNHAATHLSSKHEGGMVHHAHQHEAGVTTHHAGMDGMVEGPHEHQNADEAGEHMKQVMGEDGGNGAVDAVPSMAHGMDEPALY